MPTLLIRHKVEDYVAWKEAFDQHAATRRANGSQGGRLFRNAADPNDIVILLAWDLLERARLFADSDDLREAMARAGVASSPEIWFLEELDCPAVRASPATVPGQLPARTDHRAHAGCRWPAPAGADGGDGAGRGRGELSL